MKINLILLFILGFLLSLNLASSLDLNSCQNFTLANNVYTLTQNVNSSAICFGINAANITLDCSGFTITGTNTSNSYGILTSQFNVTIKNCNISNFTNAIYLNGADNSTILNTSVSTTATSGYGLYLNSNSNDNFVNELDAYSGAAGAVYIYGSYRNKLNKIIAYTPSTNTAFIISTGASNTVTNSSAQSAGTALYVGGATDYNNITNFFANGSTGLNVYWDGTNWADYNRFVNITAIGTGKGMTMTVATHTTVINSTIRGGTNYGVELEQSYTIYFDNVNISSNSESAIKGYSEYGIIKNCYLETNSSSSDKYAGYLYWWDDGNISDNTFVSRAGYNLYLNCYRCNVFNNTFIKTSNSGYLVYVSGYANNTFYWNNFTDTSTGYLLDSSTNTKLNTTISGRSEGNIWGNVINRSVNISGEYLSSGFSNLYLGKNGSDYPYRNTTSLSKLYGPAIDYAPLTPQGTIYPLITILFPQNNQIFASNIFELNYSVIPDAQSQNLDSCWFTNDSGITNLTIITPGFNFTEISSINGSNTWKIYCNDSNNDLGTATTSFLIDVIAPIFHNSSYIHNEYKSLFAYQINATDQGALSCFTINDTTNFNINCSGYLKNNTALNVGLYNLNITVNDSVNNINYTNLLINVSDTTVPIITIIYPVNNTKYNFNISILNYSVLDNSTLSNCWWSNNSGFWNSTVVNAKVNFTSLTSYEGSNIWTVYCNDTYNNIGNKITTFFKDTTLPQFNNLTNQSTTEVSSLFYQINATDLNNISCFTVNDTTNFNINCSGYLKNNTFLIGARTYWLNITINDSYNNRNSAIMFVNVTDTNYPIFNNLTNKTIYQNSTFNYQINATDLSGISCFTVNDTTNFNINCSGYLKNNTALNVGLYNLNITVNDTSNNLNSAIILINVTLIPRINLNLILPTTNINASIYNTFEVSVNISCSNTDCGEINVTLDPSSVIYNFTTCGTSGRTGPTQTNCNNAYNNTPLQDLVKVNNGIQNFTVPYSGFYTIEVAGARGGGNLGSTVWGNGSKMIGTFNLVQGTILQILVGQNGSGTTYTGGGGGSFVANGSNYSIATPMIIAGGGGGGSGLSGSYYFGFSATIITNGTNGQGVSNNKGVNGSGGGGGGSSYSGSGGGGFYSNGGSSSYAGIGGVSFISGGNGSSSSYAAGGFGGGGGNGWWGAGGGGGYSGGGGGSTDNYGAGGAGSYNIGTNQNNTAGINSKEGYVILTYLGGKGGTVSMNSSEIPFYTTIKNPYNLTLNRDQSQIITWSVNATGIINNTYEFFVYANKTSDFSIGNITQKWNVTITGETGILPPSISIIYPVYGNNYSINISELNYSVSGANLSICWYSLNLGINNSSLYSAGINFTNLESIEGTNTWIVYCNGTNNTIGSSTTTFLKDTIYPTWSTNKTNLNSTSAYNSSVYFNITLNDTNPSKYIFSWFNGTAWVNNTPSNYSANLEINVSKTISVDMGNISWTWYFNDSLGNLNQTDIWSVNLLADNNEGIILKCEAGGPYQQSAVVLIQGNLTNLTSAINNNNISILILNSTGIRLNNNLTTSSLGTFQTSYSNLNSGVYTLNVSTTVRGYNQTCLDSFQVGNPAYFILDKIVTIYNLTDNSLDYNISLNIINIGGSNALVSLIQDSDSNESPYNLETIYPNSSNLKSYIKTYNRNSSNYNVTLSVARVNAIDSYSGNEISANSTQIILNVPALETDQQLTITKNAYYNSENSTNINYTISLEVINSGGMDLVDITLIDSDLDLLETINLNKTQNYTYSGSIIINKAASNSNKLFVKTSASVNSVTYLSNQINMIIPGYGGPADTYVYAPESISSYTSFDSVIRIKNLNNDIGQNFIIDYWITNSEETINYTSGQATVYVSALGETNTTITLTSPSTVGNYRLRALTTYTKGLDTSYDSFLVISGSIGETNSGLNTNAGSSGGGIIIGNVILNPNTINLNSQINDFEINTDENLSIKISLNNLNNKKINATLIYTLVDSKNNILFVFNETLLLENQLEFIKKFELPENLDSGEYKIYTDLNYENKTLRSTSLFSINRKEEPGKLESIKLIKINFEYIKYIIFSVIFIILFYLFIKNFKLIRKNNKKYLSSVYNKKVYSEEGEYIGKIKEVYIVDYKIHSWLIKIDNKKIRKKDVKKTLIAQKHIVSIGDVLIIDKISSDYLENL